DYLLAVPAKLVAHFIEVLTCRLHLLSLLLTVLSCLLLRWVGLRARLRDFTWRLVRRLGCVRVLLHGVRRHEHIAHALEDIAHAAWVRRHKQHVGIGVIRYIHHRIQVLGNQHQCLWGLFDTGVAQHLILRSDTFDNFLTLFSYTATLQLASFSRTFRFLNHANLFCFCLSNRSFTLTLCGVDGVHRFAYSRIRANISNKSIDEVPAVLRHVVAQGQTDVLGDGVLGREGIIQVHVRYGGADIVLNIGDNLLLVVGQSVERFAFAAFYNFILNRHWNLHEDVVFRLGFHHDIQLVNLERNLISHTIDVRQFEVKACVRNRIEFTKTLDDRCFTSTNNEVAVKNG